jgi:hypothetical protein
MRARTGALGRAEALAERSTTGMLRVNARYVLTTCYELGMSGHFEGNLESSAKGS